MPKKVYLSFLLHGNMCYDRYTKHEIREKFPALYATGLREIKRFPEVTAHIDFPGLTTLSLKHYAPWFMDELRPLIAGRQVVMVGCQYGASHAMCSDEESDLIAGRLGMQIIRDELQSDVATFFPQEIAFHPQMPYIMNQIGARRLIVAPPERWLHPKRVRGLDGSTVDVYPLDKRFCRADRLNELYDSAEDGDFVLAGGDFEMLVNIESYVRKIDELAQEDKIIEWTTVDRYEREVGIREDVDTPGPFGYTVDDTVASPSFSRWVAHPDDPAWHVEAIRAADALRTAGFVKAAAALHGLGIVDTPWQDRWATEPANPYSRDFEDAAEFPETESRYLTDAARPTLLSRAWHHLLIGLNSDSSGWAPWQPRTRHRMDALRTSQVLAREAINRFAQQLARDLQPHPATTGEAVLVINPGPARTVEVTVPTSRPMNLIDAEAHELPGTQSFRDGGWTATARTPLPAYGYALFGLAPTEPPPAPAWTEGKVAEFADWRVELTADNLVFQTPSGSIGLSLPPFSLCDPAGTAPTDDVTPSWKEATARTRETPLGTELEVFLEVAWTVWLRLTIALRPGQARITAEVTFDRPRRIGNPASFDPEGLLLQFAGQPGCGVYDTPYATVEHPVSNASFVATQRFVGVESLEAPFGVIALGGNQSFRLDAGNGTIGASLGASIKGRPDLRPECQMQPNGTARHVFVSGGDPFFGTYTHRFVLVCGDRTELTTTAHALRTGAPAVRVAPGTGTRPTRASLFDITPDTVHATAFRTGPSGVEVVINNPSAASATLHCNGQSTELPGHGIATVQG